VVAESVLDPGQIVLLRCRRLEGQDAVTDDDARDRVADDRGVGVAVGDELDLAAPGVTRAAWRTGPARRSRRRTCW